MNKKLAIVITLVLVTQIIVINAEENGVNYTSQEKFNLIDSFFNKINYGLIKGEYLFTGWGTTNCCAAYAKADSPPGGGYKWLSAGQTVKCTDFCSYDKCAIDTWYSSTFGDIDWNNFYGETSGQGASFKNNFQAYSVYAEVYCCPSSCTTSSHSTIVKKCESNNWVNKGSFSSSDSCSYGTGGSNICWCTDTNQVFYIDQSGNSHCSSSPSDSWCPAQNPTPGTTNNTPTSCTQNNKYCKSNSDCCSSYCDGSVNQCKDAPVQSSSCGDGVCQPTEKVATILCSFGLCSSSTKALSCNQDCKDDSINDKVQIYNLGISDVNGNKITGKLTPGQQIRVGFNTRSAAESSQSPYLVEAGIIPFSTAQAWDMAKNSGFYSLGTVTESSRDACCSGQSNIADNNEKLTAVLLAKEIWGDALIKSFDYTITVPKSTTTDLCAAAEKRSPNIYWDSTSSKYIVYAIVKNGCTKDGYKRNVFITQVVELDLNTTDSTEGTSCTNDGQCGLGESCQNANLLSYITGKTCQPTTPGNINGSEVIKKFPLTREEISKSTSGDLVTAACYLNAECGDRENYSSSCIPVSKLVSDGTLTTQGQKDLLSSAKSTITTGLIGGGVGTTLCAIGVGTGTLTGGVSTIVGCGVGAAIALIGVYEVDSKVDVKIKSLFSSELQKAINTGDSTKVGICTAEPSSSFDISAILCKAGNILPITKNCNTDGIIVIVGGMFILIIFLGAIGGKR